MTSQSGRSQVGIDDALKFIACTMHGMEDGPQHGQACWTVSELELSRAPDAHAMHIWADRTATHAIIAVTTGNTLGSSSELHYVHAKWKKPKVLSKLKGTRISAVAWDQAKVSEGSTG